MGVGIQACARVCASACVRVCVSAVCLLHVTCLFFCYFNACVLSVCVCVCSRARSRVGVCCCVLLLCSLLDANDCFTVVRVGVRLNYFCNK